MDTILGSQTEGNGLDLRLAIQENLLRMPLSHIVLSCWSASPSMKETTKTSCNANLITVDDPAG